jgi:hypothetical protein
MKIEDFQVADYSNEEPCKILNSYSLIEAIHEHFDPTASHDPAYLQMRISLLKDLFNLNKNSSNMHIEAVERLLGGFGRIKPVTLLPFEGAMEVPDSIDTEAHMKIEQQFSVEVAQIRKNSYLIQRAYITYIILNAIEPSLRSKTVALSELHADGLPQSDPGEDEDNW